MHVAPELTEAHGRADNPFSPLLSFVFREPHTHLYMLEVIHALSSITVVGNVESAAVQPSLPAITVGKAAPLHLWSHFLLHLACLVTVSMSVLPPWPRTTPSVRSWRSAPPRPR
jgi:hypothetical protein